MSTLSTREDAAMDPDPSHSRMCLMPTVSMHGLANIRGAWRPSL
jgi:hypothetical protein